MSEIQWITTSTMMVFVYNDKVLNVMKESERYKEVSKLIKANDGEGLKAYLYPEFRVKKYTSGEYSVTKEKKVVKTDTGEALPECLQNKLMEFSRESFPYKAFKKFCSNLMLNPDPRSREQLYGYLEKYAFPITNDGCFLAYKYVTVYSDGGSFANGTLVDSHSKTFNNNPGKIVAMDRDKCDSDPRNECSTGLHVAAYDYARNCGSGSVIIEVLVNPKDVVSIPKDYDFKKMRVCRYQVLRRNESEVKKSYLSSNFIAGKVKEMAETFSESVPLEKMSAKDIVAYVKEKAGQTITLSLKSKKSILRKAKELLKTGHTNEEVKIKLSGLSALQVVELVQKQTGYRITFSLKSKKAILRKANLVLTEHGLKVS